MIVYKVTNTINGKIYIGQTILSLEQRRRCHHAESKKNTCSFFNKALIKHGENNFNWDVVRICDSSESLNAFEQYYILYYNSMVNGYNMTTGGKNYKHSERSMLIVIERNRNKKPLPFRERLGYL